MGKNVKIKYIPTKQVYVGIIIDNRDNGSLLIKIHSSQKARTNRLDCIVDTQFDLEWRIYEQNQ